MKKGLFIVMALLTVFAIISCDTGSDPGNGVKIRITFNLGGAPGTPPADIELDKGTAIRADQIPSANWEGHTFEGWYNGTTKLVAGLSWQTNVTFTAKWGGGGDLSPWAPAENPEEPAIGYKDFYDGVDFEDWKYSTFAGSGNVGSIEDNGNGTYTVTIKTNPGGISLVSFNSDDWMFKNGYYMLLNFPTVTEAKPIAALTLASEGSVNDTGQKWGTECNVNTESGYIPTLDNVYLAGDIAFARDNLASFNTLYKTVFLTLVWSADEEAEYYEFTLKKLLITDGEDLTPSIYEESWTPAPVTAPTDWVDFSVNTANTSFYPSDAANSITAGANNTYTVTVATRTDGHSTVTIPLNQVGEKYSSGGYYVSVTLPAVSGASPYKVRNFVTNSDIGGWASEIQTANRQDPADAGKYVVGRIDNQWGPADNNTEIKSIELAFYWIPGTVAGTYTFTINAVKLPDPENIVAPTTPALTYFKTYLAESKWGGGTTTTWQSNYEADPFGGNFTSTATVTGPWTITGFDGDSNNVQFLIIQLSFNAPAIGNEYQFTLSDLDVKDGSGTSILSVGALTDVATGATISDFVEDPTGTYTITVTAATTTSLALVVTAGTTQAGSFNYKAVLPAEFK